MGAGMDWTKINISFERLGLTGAELEKLLLESNIFVELYSGNLVMCMTGIGNSKADVEKLLAALKEISAGLDHVELLDEGSGDQDQARAEAAIGKSKTEPDGADRLNEAAPGEYKRVKIYPIPADKFKVPLLEAEGLICASSLIPYPPGIPLVCPGEKYEKETLVYLKELRDAGGKVIGIGNDGKVLAGV